MNIPQDAQNGCPFGPSFIWFLWFKQTNETDQINQIDQTDYITVFSCLRTCSAFCWKHASSY